MNLVDRISEISVLVAGDVMLDRYWWGTVERISPEAPVPVVRLIESSFTPGGAANVAANLLGLGARVSLLGGIGDDSEGAFLRSDISAKGVDPIDLIQLEGRPTTVKTRVVAHGQHVVRVDSENSTPLNGDHEAIVFDRYESLLKHADIVVLSDYAKGFLTESLVAKMIAAARNAGKRIVVDPKGLEYARYKGATLITPNQKEAAEACKLGVATPNLVETAGERLLSEIELEMLLITQGEHGMTLFQKGHEVQHLHALSQDIFDVTGAGDTVVACMAACLAAGADAYQAAAFANAAAGIVVGQVGTTAITSELMKSVSDSDEEQS
ncbi:MAG: D-glycero-beta-D-manno-heptose-7-phosphate kinase [Blastocatellia bacterium]|nr:D-glycero-beta-D-manno-heptose-7-phosphate kinase [Blastocatellia bacterium]